MAQGRTPQASNYYAQVGVIVLDEASTPLVASGADTPGQAGTGGAQDTFHRSWVMILPQGTFDTAKYGELDFTRKILSEIKANFDGNARGIDIALDYDHHANEGDSRAPGWIERLALGEEIGRDAGLWAWVRWTTLGLADVRAEIYRYISAEYMPTYHNDFTGQDYKHVLVGATLTNRPVMKIMPAIALSERKARKAAHFQRPGHYTKSDRTQIPADDFAGPHESFPIETQHDVQDAARLVGHAQDKAAVEARIKRIARRDGFTLPKAWQGKQGKQGSHAMSEGTAQAPRRSWYPRRGFDW